MIAAGLKLKKLTGGLRKSVLSNVERSHLVKVTGLEGPGMSTALVEALVARTVGHMPTKVKAQADGYLIYLSDKDSSQRLSSMTGCRLRNGLRPKFTFVEARKSLEEVIEEVERDLIFQQQTDLLGRNNCGWAPRAQITSSLQANVDY